MIYEIFLRQIYIPLYLVVEYDGKDYTVMIDPNV